MGGTNATRSARWPGATSVGRPAHLLRAPRHLDRRRERQPDQPVRGRLDDHERRRRRRGRRSARPGRTPACSPSASPGRSGGRRRCRCRPPRRSRRAAPPPRAGAATGPRSAGPSRWPKSNRPCPTAVATSRLPHLAQRGRLGVGHPQHPVAHREPRGLGEERLGGRAVAQPLVGGARPRGRRTGGRVPRPELVVARHRHHHAPVPPGQVPRRRQLGRGRSRRDARRAAGRRCPPPC